METQQFETGSEGGSAEAFFSRVEENLKLEEQKLAQMDRSETVPKAEYKEIQKQAKLVAFLRAMRDSAELYDEAVKDDNISNQAVMKKYLNV
jgi:hypothetical protein